jgi:hypothetical protein
MVRVSILINTTPNCSSLLNEYSDGPKFLSVPNSYQVVRLNDSLKIKCDVDSNPTAAITWQLNGTKLPVSSRVLEIVTVKADHYGTYTCVASVAHFPELVAQVKVLQPGKPSSSSLCKCYLCSCIFSHLFAQQGIPTITAQSKQFLTFGEEGNVECFIEQEPKAERIEWFRADVRISNGKGATASGYNVRNIQIDEHGVRSIMTIRQVERVDLANFTCKASNSFGFSSSLIVIEPRGILRQIYDIIRS